MPQSPPQLRVARNAGAPQTGAVAAAYGDVCQLTLANTSGVSAYLWQIFSYPPGWACPAGWSTDSVTGIYYSTAAVPPPFTLPGSVTWGKWMLRATINGDSTLIDESTALEITSGHGLHDIGFYESSQFGGLYRGWLYDLQLNLRLIETNLGGGGGGGPGTGAAHAVLTMDPTGSSYVWQTLFDANIAAGAGIAGSKVSPDFGAQAVKGASLTGTSGSPWSAGVTTVDLTTATGGVLTLASGQVEGHVLVLVGAISSPVTVKIEASAGEYVVNNTTSQVVTLQTTGDTGAGVAVPASTPGTVWVRGGNCEGFVASGVTLGGDLQIASPTTQLVIGLKGAHLNDSVGSPPAAASSLFWDAVDSAWVARLPTLADLPAGLLRSDGSVALTGPWNVGSEKITGLADATSALDAVNLETAAAVAASAAASALAGATLAGDVTGSLSATAISALAVAKLAPAGTNGYVLTTVGGVTAWAPAAGGATTPTGSGFVHITGGTQDGAARAVNLASGDVTGLLPVAGLAAASAGQILGYAGGVNAWISASGLALTGAVGGTLGATTINLAAGASVTGALPLANLVAAAGAGYTLVSNGSGVTTWQNGLTDGYISASAAIAGTKISPNFGAQLVQAGGGFKAPSGTVYLEPITNITGLTGGAVALSSAQEAYPHVTIGGALTSDLTLTVTDAQVDGCRITFVNNCTGAFKTTFGGLWIAPGGNVTEVYYDGAAWQYGRGCGASVMLTGTITIHSPGGALAAAMAALAKIPAHWEASMAYLRCQTVGGLSGGGGTVASNVTCGLSSHNSTSTTPDLATNAAPTTIAAGAKSQNNDTNGSGLGAALALANTYDPGAGSDWTLYVGTSTASATTGDYVYSWGLVLTRLP